MTRINAKDFLFLGFFRVYSRDSRASFFVIRHSPAAPYPSEGGWFVISLIRVIRAIRGRLFSPRFVFIRLPAVALAEAGG